MPYVKKGRTKNTAAVSLILIFVFMFVAAGFNNDWGRVHISDVYYSNSGGGMIHAQLFVPENASSANPLPAILNMHGGSDYLQTVSNYSLELARRGYVVLSVDACGDPDYQTVFQGDREHLPGELYHSDAVYHDAGHAGFYQRGPDSLMA